MLPLLAQSSAVTQPATQAATRPAGITTLPEAAGKLEDLGRQTVGKLPDVLVALGVFAAFLLLAWAISRLVRWYTRKERKHGNLTVALGRLASGLTMVVGLLVASVIAFENFTPTKMIELLGLGSVAIGFAFRDVLQNYLAGILLLLTEPFRIGDQIIFGSYEGTVEDIQTRATFVRTYDGRRVVIPNGELFTNSVLVNTAFEKRRLEYDVGIGYGDDIDLAKRLILEALHECEAVIKEPRPDVLTFELAGSSVNIRARWWVEPPQKRDTLESRDQVLSAIKKKLLANGVDLPLPTQQVLLHDQTEEADGDRRRQREGWPAGKGEVPRPRWLAGGTAAAGAPAADAASGRGDGESPGAGR
jgi:small conductance mechanosensitive channel